MAFRTRGRRRRPAVQWLPVFGNGGDENNEQAIGLRTEITLSGDPDATRVDAAGVTFDYSDSAEVAQLSADQRTLHDLVAGNSYRLRRIVGKYFAAWFPNGGDGGAGPGVPPAIDLAAGFIIVRTDDSGNPTTDFEEVHPLSQDSAEDPWIWRRRWVLRTYNTTNSTIPGYTWAQNFPGSTAGYGSVLDGPHIDQKTARTIDRQERLFFVQAARVYDAADQNTYTAAGFIQSLLDYRLLGSIRSASRGNRGNASR